MSCKECGVQSEVAHRLSCPTLKQPAPPPPTLAEACEVIEALLDEPEDCACHLEPVDEPCLFHAPAVAFLERVRGRHG